MMTTEKQPYRSIHTGQIIPKPARTFRATAPRRQLSPKAKPLTRKEIEACYDKITDPRARARFRAIYAKELGIQQRKGR